MRVTHVVGARPNFMKVGPVMSALSTNQNIVQTLVHTGQHYDKNMSEVFFKQLGLPKPDVNLDVGSGTHAFQVANIILRFEDALKSIKPDIVLVYGDVNSTMAAAIVCSKTGVAVAHVEAGLRSFDRTMPEESNRVITDHLANLLFTPSVDAEENLIREGIDANKIKFVGNVMIDTLVRLLPSAEERWPIQSRVHSVCSNEYGLVTLHRGSNVDDIANLAPIVDALRAVGRRKLLIFPVHPRTRTKLESIAALGDGIRFTEPMGYLEFLCMQRHASFVITDSGGIQEETTYLGIPCITLRKNTERPITLALGTNHLVGEGLERLVALVDRIIAGESKRGSIPPLWDGRAGQRIATCIANYNGVG